MVEETRTPETADLIEADRREPRVSAFAGGVSSDEQHASLRASVRQLGRLLGEAISRHQGPETLALVEQVRELSRDPDDGDLHALLSEQDDATAVTLARAFTTGRIREALDEGSLSPELLTEVLGRVEYRPVFTAHPTESTRRTVLRLLRKVAATIAAAEDPRRRPGDDARTERRLAELVDLLWQTDELRIAKPQPTDEARTALYYLAQIAQHVIPGLMEELQHQLGTVGVELPADARPLRFGTWAGGDRDGNPFVTPEVTLEVLGLQHDFGLRELVRQVEELLTEMSASTRVVDVTEELQESLAADAEALPITYSTIKRLNAEEPYRLKLSFVRVRLQRTRDRLANGTAHEPGRDYLGFAELLRDLTLVRDSMLADGDTLTGNGAILRMIRTATATGLGMATLDVREHSGKHHDALAELFDRTGELDVPYADLDREQRIELLSREMAGRRPLVGAGHPLGDGQAAASLELMQTLRTALDTYGPDVVETYIVSMAHDVDDLFAVVVLSGCSRTRRTVAWSPPAGTCRRSCSATQTPPRTPASPPRSGRSTAPSGRCATSPASTACGCGSSTAAAARWVVAVARRRRRSSPSPTALSTGPSR